MPGISGHRNKIQTSAKTPTTGGEKKRKVSPQPPPNTPCSTPETPTTPPGKRARSMPVLKAKSSGRKVRPRTVQAAHTGTKRQRSWHDKTDENGGPSEKRQCDDILMDLTSRVEAIHTASGKRDRVVLPTVLSRPQGAPHTSKAVHVSITAVVKKLERQLAEATPTICDMSLRNGKIKLN